MEENIYTEENSTQKLSLLEKLNKERTDRNDKKQYNEFNILFVKTSSDEMIINFTNKFLTELERVGNSASNNSLKKNIGIKRTIKYIDDQKGNNCIKLNIYDYNYLLSKKFKYLKNQAILFADNYIFVINIYDIRSLENFKFQYEEIKKLKKSNDCFFFAIILKFCNNFLYKLSEQQIVNELKLENYFQKIIEFDHDSKIDFNSTLYTFLYSNKNF